MYTLLTTFVLALRKLRKIEKDKNGNKNIKIIIIVTISIRCKIGSEYSIAGDNTRCVAQFLLSQLLLSTSLHPPLVHPITILKLLLSFRTTIISRKCL